ncbi:30S ribosomal protein S10 [Mycoplasmopsis californica]|uniref:Small ribosomal subunit protein uS10 n=2 Tax=Mycoplasmopsis californica TaxID=2113 RepID=A0A059XRF4_9BACT|nr:30S ribosomal protein S10 [Mycoplasmopsis californica]AIA29620.1 30S ribosomal protein S10 [Mycoplasmopsis californica]
MSKINIKLKAFEHEQLDFAAKKIVEIAQKNNVKFSGPVAVPTRRHVVTILRSVHINKTSREQFEARVHQRIVTLINADAKTLDQIRRFEFPAGVQISEIKQSK